MTDPPRPPPLTMAQRDKLIEEYAPTIRYLAQRLAFRLPPSLDVDDLVHAGIIGLIDALEKFDSSRQIKFKTYAEFRIRGAMLDQIRSLDWVPRSIREKISLLHHTLEKLERTLGRPASEEELATALQMNPGQFHTFISQARAATLLSFEDLGLKEGGEHNLFESLADAKIEDPLLSVLSRDMREILIKAISQLPKKEQMVISLYYDDELTMKEIGNVINITEPRVCQLHTQAILRLKSKLKSMRE